MKTLRKRLLAKSVGAVYQLRDKRRNMDGQKFYELKFKGFLPVYLGSQNDKSYTSKTKNKLIIEYIHQEEGKPAFLKKGEKLQWNGDKSPFEETVDEIIEMLEDDGWIIE